MKTHSSRHLHQDSGQFLAHETMQTTESSDLIKFSSDSKPHSRQLGQRVSIQRISKVSTPVSKFRNIQRRLPIQGGDFPDLETQQ